MYQYTSRSMTCMGAYEAGDAIAKMAMYEQATGGWELVAFAIHHHVSSMGTPLPSITIVTFYRRPINAEWAFVTDPESEARRLHPEQDPPR